jgi:hypothetical protein
VHIGIPGFVQCPWQFETIQADRQGCLGSKQAISHRRHSENDLPAKPLKIGSIVEGFQKVNCCQGCNSEQFH